MSESRSTTSGAPAIPVDLLGVRLHIRTEQPAAEVEQVVADLRARVERIRQRSGAVDTIRLAILVALEVNRELLDCRVELEALREATTERTLALVERLEAETGAEPGVELEKLLG